MKAGELCCREVRAVRPDASLSVAGVIMWDHDCGFVPIVDGQRKVVGDRDIAIAAATQSRPVAEISVLQVAGKRPTTCHVNDEVAHALELMRTKGVRRLPVVDSGGVLQGVLSITDILHSAKAEKSTRSSDITYEDVVLALQAIAHPHRGEEQEAAGAALLGSTRK